MEIKLTDWDSVYKMLPTWKEVFESADKETKRVLINKIVDKVIITKEEIRIKFKINISEPRMREYKDTIPCKPCSG